MTLTDGNGNSVTVNLAGAVTLQDVIERHQQPVGRRASVGITAEVNAAGDGIQLVDTSGGSADR